MVFQTVTVQTSQQQEQNIGGHCGHSGGRPFLITKKKMKLKKKKEPVTFQEIYEDVKNSKHPATVFVENVAAATMKTVPAVRQWIAGTRVPDELTQAAIGRLLGRDPKKLFPKK